LVECIEKLKPNAVFTSWLTSVDKEFVVGYFKRLNSDFPKLDVFAGGAQIKPNSEALKKFIVEVSDISSITNHMKS
jgi:hypothetical protein